MNNKKNNTDKIKETNNTNNISEMIEAKQTPTICIPKITNSMGLRLGQEEKYPEIKHINSNEQPTAIPYLNLNKIKHILPNGTVIKK